MRVMEVRGEVASGFDAVRDVFTTHLSEVGDGGAAFAAVADGELVVDLWAGSAGATPWSAHTRAVLMSATKGITAIAVARLAARGLLDVDAPVAAYWPEFAAAGKGAITVAQVLSHSAGVVTIPGHTDFIGPAGEGWERTDEIRRRLESASPVWLPGTAHGYHGLTFGWLVGEIVRRAAGVSAGNVIRDEIAGQLGLELELGTPIDRQDAVAPVIVAGPPLTTAAQAEQLMDPASPFARMILAVNGQSVLDAADVVFAKGRRLAIELPGSNATGTARALARLYGAVAAGGRHDGERIAPRAVIERFAAERARGPSWLTGEDERWGLGFQLPLPPGAGLPNEWGPHEEAFGHKGLGGQIGFADPISHVGVAMVRSHLSATSPLGGHLVEALYECL
jgi:CubicO group peptidase (beta-lactamase class C family)